MQDLLKRKVSHHREKERLNKMELKGGWYTESAMATKLKLCEILVCIHWLSLPRILAATGRTAVLKQAKGRHQDDRGLHIDKASTQEAPARVLQARDERPMPFLHSCRRWKYNKDVMQHWVETDEEGTVTYLEREKMHEQVEVDFSAIDSAPLGLETPLRGGSTESMMAPPEDGGWETEAGTVWEYLGGRLHVIVASPHHRITHVDLCRTCAMRWAGP